MLILLNERKKLKNLLGYLWQNLRYVTYKDSKSNGKCFLPHSSYYNSEEKSTIRNPLAIR